MNDTHDPDRFDDRLVPYVLGELAPEEARAFERVLAADAALRDEAERLRQALGVLPLAAVQAPPPALRARVLAAAAREAAPAREAATAREAAPIRRVRRAWLPMAAAAAVLIAVMSLPFLDAARTRRQLLVEREVHDLLVQPNLVRSFRMTGEGPSRAAFGAVLLDLDDKKAAVALRGLPAPPAGRIYRLWAEVGTRAVFCGQLNPDDAAVVRSQLPIPVESYKGTVTRLYVTLDPEDSPLQPTGPTVLSST